MFGFRQEALDALDSSAFAGGSAPFILSLALAGLRFRRRQIPYMNTTCRICAGVLFSPPFGGGKRQNRRYFPPILETSGGEISDVSPPILEGCGGEIFLFPPHLGGETEKILGNRTPKLSIFLKEIAFLTWKLSKFSPAAR